MNPLKVGVIGVGGIAGSHFPGWKASPDAELYAFADPAAPVLERALARNAGLGWIGKHTCLIDKDGGSWFFLGEIYVDLPLPIDAPASEHCGTCARCIDVCPTQAITAPVRVLRRMGEVGGPWTLRLLVL